MWKVNLFLMFFLILMTVLTAKTWSYHHGIFTGIQGGMLNTVADEGKNPDTGTLGAHFAYLGAYQKEHQKNYSYFKGGLDYEASFGPKTPLQGFGLFVDSGAVLFDMWRLGAGVAFNYLTKKDVTAGLMQGFVVSPYLETAIMYKPFKQSGFDFGFRLGFPVKVTGSLQEPYYQVNKLNQIDWKLTAGYFHFF